MTPTGLVAERFLSRFSKGDSMVMLRATGRWPIAFLVLALGGCASYQEHLNRGQRLFEDDRYEDSLAVWRLLERDLESLGDRERARYFYLRGMTDYRLGYRQEARHWLALAGAVEQVNPGALDAAWRERMSRALDDLNGEVWGHVQQAAASVPTK